MFDTVDDVKSFILWAKEHGAHSVTAGEVVVEIHPAAIQVAEPLPVEDENDEDELIDWSAA